jgi:hypothetical protein
MRRLHGCHSERSEESLQFVLGRQKRTAEILRSTQNDSLRMVLDGTKYCD